MEESPTRICELIVGFGEVEVLGTVGVLGVDDKCDGPPVLHTGTRRLRVCGGCGGRVWSEGSARRGLWGRGRWGC